MSSQTAWPHRPPLGVTLALLASVVLCGVYCFATVQLLPTQQRELFPVYRQSGIRSMLHMPTFGRKVTNQQTFVFPDKSKITIQPKKLHDSLQSRVYGGRSVKALFKTAAYASVVTLMLLVILGATWDRRHVQDSRDGRLLRGPRYVNVAQYNRETDGDGIVIEASDLR